MCVCWTDPKKEEKTPYMYAFVYIEIKRNKTTRKLLKYIQNSMEQHDEKGENAILSEMRALLYM